MSRKLIIVVSLSLILLGVWLLLGAPAWAVKSADRWLIHDMRGSSPTNQYDSVMRSYGLAYSLLGGISVTFGLARLLWPTNNSGL